MLTSNERIKNSKSRFVRISSQDRVIGTNNQFTVDLASNGGALDNVKGYIVHSAQVPNIFTNVSSWNNTLVLYAGAGAPYTVTAVIPEGNYTIDTLITELDSVLTPLLAAAPFPSGVNISKVGTAPQEKINFQFFGDDWYLLKDPTTMKRQIGIDDSDFGPYPIGGGSFPFFDGINTVMPSFPNLTGETACYVHSRILATNNLTEGNGTFSVVDKINLDEQYGAMCYTNYNNDLTHQNNYFPFETKKTLRRIDINLRNENGDQLILPSNFYFSMMIKIFYS
jgi:hypothetical protein